MRLIISGGGSGGHIFPAIAIADKVKEKNPDAQILFVGAEGKMEMEKVPKAGYSIEGLPIRGLQRKLTLKNLAFPFRLVWSLWKARRLVRNYQPDIVIGVGGYASGPVMRAATNAGIKTLVQEQNSYPGITNKILASKVDRICVAYPKMDKFFPKEKIKLTGNPVRAGINNNDIGVKEARKHFGLDPNKKTVLLFGGSLGASSLNKTLAAGFDLLQKRNNVQWIWQAGKLYIDEYKKSNSAGLDHVKIMAFIDRMDIAYKAADVAVTRAGALSISEIALVGQPAILVPSPNVAEDHQTKNALALVDAGAARIVRDNEAKGILINEALHLIENKEELRKLSKNVLELARPNATEQIVEEIFKLCI